MPRLAIALLPGLLVSPLASGGAAPSCAPPPRFAPAPVPTVDVHAYAQLTYTVTDTVHLPLAAFQRWFDAAPLETLLPGTHDIPAVTGTRQLGGLAFPAVGAARYVCLADGSAAVEQIIDVQPERRFEYVVWNYTLAAARALKYGHGLFEFASLGDATEVRWTYSFELDGRRMPGRLGAVGRWLFRRSFLVPKFQPFMHAGMRAIRSGAERAHASANADPRRKP